MKGFLGIDLGSTTTKAVFLGEAGEPLGKGLTNTRANFETASSIARTEALADARFTLLSTLLAAGGRKLADEARDGHRHAERRSRLNRLHGRCRALLGDVGNGDTARVEEALGRLFQQLSGGGAETQEALFGDTLHAEAAQASEEASTAARVPYERLMGLFERALVADEADPTAVDPRETLATLAEGRELSDDDRRAFHRASTEPIEVVAQAGTGYGRHRLPFAKEEIRSEILCHGLGCRHAYPDTRTILDIGGQDTKAIQLDEQGLVTSFQMNDRCAAGCGRYLGYVADELGLRIGDLGPLAMESGCPSRINSTCTVFAGTEIRERMALGETREDVVAGLHRAIVVRALSLLSRSGGVRDALTFSGGVGRNPAVVKYLQELVAEHYGNIRINVSSDSIYNGAYGAALFARMDAQEVSC